MALYTGSGAKSWFAIGRNNERGGKITTFSTPDNTQDPRVPGMTQKRFPFSEFAINELAEAIANNLITGFGSRAAAVFGQFSAGGRIVTGVIPQDIFHLLLGVLNSDSLPSSTKIVNVNQKSTPDDVIKTSSTIADITTAATEARKIAAGKPPSRVKFTFDTAPTAGTIVLKGHRKIGRPSKDFFTVTERLTPRTAQVYSTKYLTQLDSVVFTGITGATNVGLEWDSNTYDTTGKFNTAATQFPGWTVQGSDGGQPFVAEDITPVRANISIGTGGVSLTVEVVGTRKDELRILTSDAETYEFPESELSHFPLGSDRQQPVWGASFMYDDTIIKATNIEIAASLNIGTDNAFDGSRFVRDVVQDGNREVDFNPTLRFVSGTQASDVFAKWQEIFRNDDRSALIFRGYNYHGNGSREIIEVRSPSSQLVTNEIVTSGAGPIDRRLNFYGLPSAGETSEIIVRTETQEEFSEG